MGGERDTLIQVRDHLPKQSVFDVALWRGCSSAEKSEILHELALRVVRGTVQLALASLLLFECTFQGQLPTTGCRGHWLLCFSFHLCKLGSLLLVDAKQMVRQGFWRSRKIGLAEFALRLFN